MEYRQIIKHVFIIKTKGINFMNFIIDRQVIGHTVQVIVKIVWNVRSKVYHSMSCTVLPPVFLPQNNLIYNRYVIQE